MRPQEILNAKTLLCFYFPVDKKHNQCTDYCNCKTPKVKTINLTIAKERTYPATDYGTNNPQDNSDNKTTSISTRHNPLSQDTCYEPEHNSMIFTL